MAILPGNGAIDSQTYLSPTSHEHATEIFCVRACTHADALDLVAVGGENHVEVIQRDPKSLAPSFKVIASFHIGCSVNAISWSPQTVSPAVSEKWFLKLVVAGSDDVLRLLTKSSLDADDYDTIEGNVTPFGGGLSGHHGRINDVCFCLAETYHNNVASIGNDVLILWNLNPTNASEAENEYDDDDDEGGDTEEEVENDLNFSMSVGSIDQSQLTSPSKGTSRSKSAATRQHSKDQTPAFHPTAYPITFPHPLHTVTAHPKSANQFVVSDSRGTVFVVNWTELGQENAGTRRHRVVELTDPRALTDGLTSVKGAWSGGASWKPNDVNLIGATYGNRWSVWDMRKLQGGKPVASGEGHAQGGSRFRWCPTDPHLFAVSTESPLNGALMKVYHTSYPNAPRTYPILPRPHRVRDFDWLGEVGPEDTVRAWMAVAVGRKLFFLAGGDPLPANLA
ncbi:hypothetical protein FRC02_007933 [Tulasnella sp. 418]|nr:hypothetical protein FRC02_007933 [Tulasnella sp. 418]